MINDSAVLVLIGAMMGEMTATKKCAQNLANERIIAAEITDMRITDGLQSHS